MQWLRSAQFLVLGFTSFGARGYHQREPHFTRGALDRDLRGKHYVVTGASSGLGRSCSEELGRRGATVHLVVRSAARAEEVAANITASGGTPVVHICDLSSLSSVQSFADRWGTARIDALVNNAGVMVQRRADSADGVELNFATNTLGTFALTEALLPALTATAGARVVTVSSGGMYTERLVVDDLAGADITRGDTIDGTRQYARNKRQQIALTEHWARTHHTLHWSVMHPGWADTPGVATSMPEFYSALKNRFRTVEQGADTIVWLAIADEAVKYPSGKFFFDRQPVNTHLFAAGTSYTKQAVDSLVENLRRLIDEKGVDLPQAK